MEGLSTAFDYWAKPVIESSIEEAFYCEYSPASTFSRGTPIEFIVPGVQRHYLDLWRSYMYARVKVTLANGNDIPNDANVGPVNLFLHSLYRNVEVELGNRLISSQDGLYPFRAYIETLLNFGEELKSSQLQCALWYKDTGEHMNAADATNAGWVSRAEYVTQSGEVEMIGRPHADIFHQERPIIGGCGLRLRLHPANDSFVLMTPAPGANHQQVEYRVQLVAVKLFIRTLKVSSALVLAHEEMLLRHNAIFPIRLATMKHVTVTVGQTSALQDNLYLGEMPRRLVVGLIADAALNGHYQQNPFNFQHFGLNFIALYVNGEAVPSRPYQPNFVRQQYLREYMSLFEGTGTLFTDKTVSISRREYATGYTLFVFNLTPAVEVSSSIVASATTPSRASPRSGSVRLELKFTAPTDQVLDIICYAEYDSAIEIDSNRNVIL